MKKFEVKVVRYATQYHTLKVYADHEQEAIRCAEYQMDEDDAWEDVAEPEVEVEVINCEEVCDKCGAPLKAQEDENGR